MNRTKVMAVVCSAALSVLMTACGGSNGGNATISGTVNNLDAGSSVSLTNNGSAPLTVSANGRFTFSNTVASNSGYSVVVSSQPAKQTCVVNNGSGLVDFSGNNVTNVVVNCSDNVPIGVMVTGLGGAGATFRLTLQNDAQNKYDLNVNANGTIENFPVLLPLGTLYNVAVYLQPGQTLPTPATSTTPATPGTPPTQTCSVNSGSSYSGGVVSSAAIVVGFTCH